MSKYPNTIRKTAGQLSIGDSILVRDRGSDTLWIQHPRWDTETRAMVEGVELARGVHKVAGITSALHRHHGGKASRYYTLTLEQDGNTVEVETSSVQRLNLIEVGS